MAETPDQILQRFTSRMRDIDSKKTEISIAKTELGNLEQEAAGARQWLITEMVARKLSDPVTDYIVHRFGPDKLLEQGVKDYVAGFLDALKQCAGKEILVYHGGRTRYFTGIDQDLERQEARLSLGVLTDNAYDITFPDRNLVAVVQNPRYFDMQEGKWKQGTEAVDFNLNVFVPDKSRPEEYLNGGRGIDMIMKAKKMSPFLRAIHSSVFQLEALAPLFLGKEFKIDLTIYDDPENNAALMVGRPFVNHYLAKLRFPVRREETVIPGIPGNENN